MEQPPAAAPKQRSPWVYVLLGCGGLAGLICLGTALVGFLGVKAVKDVSDGVTDPETRSKNAIKQLGGIPEGYRVAASMSFFVAQTTILTDAPETADGGFELSGDAHTFTFFRVMANENNKKARDFLSGKETDPQALAGSGVNIDASDIVKRGNLAIDGRKYAYVVSRGELQGTEGAKGLNNAILFECPGDALHVGVWSQRDPAPDQASDAIDLADTVADEAQLVRFLKPMNPCGR
jgi:hypothetical protein